ncbi:MAG: helix-turn-helix domain-containing protein [Clostridia bacterium]
MGHLHCSTIERKNKHLTYKDRLSIETMNNEKKSTEEISKVIVCSRRTIQRELKKGRVTLLDGQTWIYYEGYSAEVAQNRYEENKQAKGPALKIGHDHHMCEFIENEIKAQKSSDEIKDSSLNNYPRKIRNYRTPDETYIEVA